jgi:hypothetical protein
LFSITYSKRVARLLLGTIGTKGGAQKSEAARDQIDNINWKTVGGTSRAYTSPGSTARWRMTGRILNTLNWRGVV